MENPQIIETENKNIDVKLGGAVVHLSRFKTGGYEMWRVMWRVGDRRFRKSRANRQKAIDLAIEKVRHLARADGERTTVDTHHLVYLRECERSVHPHALHEVCEFFRKFHVVGGPIVTLAQIINEYKDTLEKRGVSKRHKESTSSQGKVLIRWFGEKPIQSIGAKEIEEKMSEVSYSPYTKKKLISFYRALESFAKKRKYLPREFDSVTENVTLPEVKIVDYPVFTPNELKRLFIILKPHEIAYVATMAFGGARRAEFERMTNGNFDSGENSAKVDRGISKKGLPRNLHMPDNLSEWLKLAKMPDEGPIISTHDVSGISRDKDRLKQVGLAWQQNILRHSFLSYHLAKHENPPMTAYVGGTSIKMLKEHYVTLVSKRSAEDWFNITPTAVREYAENMNLTRLIRWDSIAAEGNQNERSQYGTTTRNQEGILHRGDTCV